LERVTGQRAHELIRQRVLEPLGMTSSVAAITEDVRTDLATGYEPVFTDRPAQLRHPLVPATFTVSSTVDGSIVSNVIDMAAHARLLLNRGRGPEGPVLSEAMFDVLTTPFVERPDYPGTTYGYGLVIGEDEHGPWLAHGGGMVGYTALTAVEPESGLGVVMLQNGSGSKEDVHQYAFDAVRACITDAPLPEAWTPPEPTSIPDVETFVGEYVDPEGGDVLRVQPDSDGLRIVIGEASGRLERDPLTPDAGEQFLVVHPDLERFPIRFGRGHDGRVHEAFHGSRWFRGERYDGDPPDAAPQEWLAYPGLYRNDDPWIPTLRVVLRKGQLALQFPVELSDEAGEAELQPLEDGWFAVGEPWQPRRIRFDRLVEGKAVVAEFNAGRWYRSFEE
jgi:D-alanyl-D-alanine carboxypeptidase